MQFIQLKNLYTAADAEVKSAQQHHTKVYVDPAIRIDPGVAHIYVKERAKQDAHRNVSLKRARSTDTFTFDELSAAVIEECESTPKNLIIVRYCLSQLQEKKCDFKKWCFYVRTMTNGELLAKTFLNLKKKRA